MIKIFAALLLLCCCFAGRQATAQTVCSIQYTYDADGNRVKREYACVTPPGPNDPGPPITNTGILSSVYPNPTTGVFHAVFTAAVSSAYFSIIAVSGSVVEEREVTQLSTMETFDISAQVPGNYILTVITGNDMESYTITKL